MSDHMFQNINVLIQLFHKLRLVMAKECVSSYKKLTHF